MYKGVNLIIISNRRKSMVNWLNWLKTQLEHFWMSGSAIFVIAVFTHAEQATAGCKMMSICWITETRTLKNLSHTSRLDYTSLRQAQSNLDVMAWRDAVAFLCFGECAGEEKVYCAARQCVWTQLLLPLEGFHSSQRSNADRHWISHTLLYAW